MGNTIIYNGQEYGNPIVNDTGVGEYTSVDKKKNPTGSNNEIFNSYGGTYPNVIQDKTVDDVLITSTYSHAEGCKTLIDGASYAHAEGYNTAVSSDCGHAEGQNTIVSGLQSHAEGQSTTASGWAAHAEGASTQAIGANAHAEGNGTIASGNRSHAEGDSCVAFGEEAHAEGQSCTANGTNSHAEGYETLASGSQCHAEGYQTKAIVGAAAHAEGRETEATSSQAHAEGYKTKATDSATHAEGSTTLASYSFAHAEGYMTIASSTAAHAEGQETTASNSFAHTEGCMTTASGYCAHAEGQNSQATEAFAHAQNLGTIASVEAQTAIGKYNAANNSAALIIGNGTGTLVYNIYSYDDTDTYSIGNKVKREVSSNTWKIYECIEAITTAEPFDSSKWTDITNNYIISRDGNTIYETNRSNIFTVEWNGSIVTGQQSLIDSGHSGVLICGSNNTLNGGCNHSVIEGTGNTIESGSSASHVEGSYNIISGGSQNSHIEGQNNSITNGSGYSHIEGKDNIIANGAYQCHVQNLGNVANGENQTVIGKYNQPSKDQALIIGNGANTTTTVNGVEEYSSSSSYAQDSYCYRNGLVWKCLEAITSPAGTFDETKWEVQNATYNSTTGVATLRASSNAMTVSWGGVLNVIGQNADIQINGTSVATGGGGDVANPNISDAYDSTATYAVGDYCIYNDNLYIATASTTGTFDSNDWTQTTATDNIKANTAFIASAAQSISNIISMIAPTYNATSGTYSEGDYVIYNNNLYKCNTTISTAEDFDSSKWDSTTIMGAIKDIEIRLGGLSFYNGAATGTPDANTVYFIS